MQGEAHDIAQSMPPAVERSGALTLTRRFWAAGVVVLAVAGAVVAWSLAGGGADTASTPPPASPNAPTSSATSSPGTSPLSVYSPDIEVDGARLVAANAWDSAGAGDPVAAGHLVDIRVPVVQDPATHVVALTDDGGLVGVRSLVRGLDISQVTVGILKSSGALSAFTSATPQGVDPTVARQSESFATGGSHVAWVETPSTDLQFDNWSVFAADVNNGRTVALGSSQDVLAGDLLPMIGPYVAVSVGTDRAYWGTPYPRGALGADGHYADFGLKVLSRALDGSGELETVADGAILPAADGDCVVFARVHGSDPAVLDGTFRIARVCSQQPESVLATGFLGPHGKLRAVAADHGVVAWSIAESSASTLDRSDVVILDTRTHQLAVVHLTPQKQGMLPESVANLQIGDDLVQWTTDSTRALADLRDGTIWSLPASPGYYTLLQAGDWLGWQSANGANDVPTTVGRWSR